ncbi:hypothetical protein LINPERHAP2_LOCUS11962 [Linum perenne]
MVGSGGGPTMDTLQKLGEIMFTSGGRGPRFPYLSSLQSNVASQTKLAHINTT